ncbi:MAG: hypothetical protein QM708_02590 [Propioniciclava sp.]|uniref:hypothetical protein n=1 Tax=Propioniciclava sp. TaxID=2038686 RepID=UPI0039E2D70C
MTLDNSKHDIHAVPPAEVDDTDAVEDAEPEPNYVMQGVITIALFAAFVAFALFCLPFYIFS